MTTYERRQSLLDMLRKQPGVRVPELAVVLGVSEGTVRNDRNARGPFQNHAFVHGRQQNAGGDLAVAREAATLVNDGGAIMRHASSTIIL